MTGQELPYITCIVIAVDRIDGRERIIRYSFAGDDHREAAAQAFRWIDEGSNVTVREILTFDQPPRRWDPNFAVEEKT